MKDNYQVDLKWLLNTGTAIHRAKNKKVINRLYKTKFCKRSVTLMEGITCLLFDAAFNANNVSYIME